MNKPLVAFGVIILVFGLILPITPIYGMMWFAPNTKVVKIWSDPATPRYNQGTYIYMQVTNPDDAYQKIWGMITDTSTGHYSKTTGISGSLTVRTMIYPKADTLIKGECGYIDNDGREITTDTMTYTIRLDTSPVVDIRVGYIEHDFYAEAGKPVYFGYVIVNQGNADATSLTVKVTDTETNQVLFTKNYGTLPAGRSLDTTMSKESFTMPNKNFTGKIEITHSSPPITAFTMSMYVKLKATAVNPPPTNSTTPTPTLPPADSMVSKILSFNLYKTADQLRLVLMALGSALAVFGLFQRR